MKLAITICSTESYSYAMTAQARRVQSAVSHIPEGFIILCGTDHPQIRKVENLYKTLFANRKDWRIEFLPLKNAKEKKENKNYKNAAQLLIGQMRTMAFDYARGLDVDYCWSLDSDVLPHARALKTMIPVLEMDDGYYSIAAAPYPSQGGGGFLCGRGTVYAPILEDVFEEERIIPEPLKKELEKIKQELKDIGNPKNEQEAKTVDALVQKLQKLRPKIHKCPPIGNVFALNAKGWRKRGWFDNAYAGIGKGSVVPSDWCGFGCTLMTKEALEVAHWDGYEGSGTEDLFIVWRRWHQQNMRIAATPHVPADHVIRNPGKEGYYILQQTYHETEGEGVGHLRTRSCPFYSFDDGEKYDPENDGKIVPPKTEPEEDDTPPIGVNTIVTQDTTAKAKDANANRQKAD